MTDRDRADLTASVRDAVLDVLDQFADDAGDYVVLTSLGLTSINVVQLRSLLEVQTGTRLALTDLMGRATISSVADAIEHARSEKPELAADHHRQNEVTWTSHEWLVLHLRANSSPAASDPVDIGSTAPVGGPDDAPMLHRIDLTDRSARDAKSVLAGLARVAATRPQAFAPATIWVADMPGDWTDLVLAGNLLGPDAESLLALMGEQVWPLVTPGAPSGPDGPEALSSAELLSAAGRHDRSLVEALSAIHTVVVRHFGLESVGDPGHHRTETELSLSASLTGPRSDLPAASIVDLDAVPLLGAATTVIDAITASRSARCVAVVSRGALLATISSGGAVHRHATTSLRRAIRALNHDDRCWTDPHFGWDPAFEMVSTYLAAEAPTSWHLGADVESQLARSIGDPHRAGTPAVVGADGTECSWEQLAKVVEGWSSEIDPGCRLAIDLPRGLDQVAAVLATSRLGATYVPLDEEWPPARKREIIDRAGVTHVAGPQGVTRVARPMSDSIVAKGPAEASYIIFTSGSSGSPKGVSVSATAARTTVDSITELYRIRSQDRVLAVSSLAFDLSVFDIFGVLGVGGSLVVVPERQRRDPSAWLRAIGEHRVTVWNSAPALATMLMDEAEADPTNAARALGDLRVVMLSGDWIPTDLPDRIRALAPQAEVIGLGGATEAAIWSNHHRVREPTSTWSSIPYGRPLPGHAFYILDEQLAPVQVGQTGHLFIGGAGLALGYEGDPELTAQQFIAHPRSGQRLYRTGDLGRWRPDGEMDFLGRDDTQVKIRGHRVELGEIEVLLRGDDDVHRCVVVVQEPSSVRSHLVAFVVPDGSVDNGLLGKRLAARASQMLPPFMHPGRIHVLDTIPLTANGKVDREHLREVDKGSAAAWSEADHG